MPALLHHDPPHLPGGRPVCQRGTHEGHEGRPQRPGADGHLQRRAAGRLRGELPGRLHHLRADRRGGTALLRLCLPVAHVHQPPAVRPAGPVLL